LEIDMDTIIVYLDEASYALRMLTPMLSCGRERSPTRWIVVACAPRMSRHISKWVTASARQSWRGEWSERVFKQVVPLLLAPGDSVTTKVSNGAICELTDTLLAQHRGARVMDARRPKFGYDMAPATSQQPQEPRGVAGYAAALAGAALLMAAD
jgi:hypothetical protein